jgi:hypothetical protein
VSAALPLVAPSALFRCEHYSRAGGTSRLSYRACIERQFKPRKVASGKHVFAMFPACVVCAQGHENAARFPDLVAGRSRPKVRPLRLPSETTSLERAVNIPSGSDQDDAGEGPLAAMVAARFGDEDAARMAELNRRIAAGEDTSPQLCPCGCLAPLRQCAEKARRKALEAANMTAVRPATVAGPRPVAVATPTHVPRPPPRAEPPREDLGRAPRALGWKPADIARAEPHVRGETLEERVKAALRLAREGLPAAPAAPPAVERGQQRASAARLARPQLTPNGVMTDRKCRCEPWCGHYLRKNNTSGWSGYCNPARYAAGERPPRPSRAKESAMPCGTCGKPGHNARGCPETKQKKPDTKARGVAPASSASEKKRYWPLSREEAALVDRAPRAGSVGPVDATGSSIQQALACLHDATVDEMLDLRLAIETELKRRKDEAEAQLVKLDAALGSKAA